MKASEIMISEVQPIRGVATVAEAIAQMKANNLRCLIVDRRHLEDAYGIVSETDIVDKVIAVGRDPQRVRVHEIMTKPCIVVNPDLEVEYVARLFANTGISAAPVIEGQLLGVISITEILHNRDWTQPTQATLLEQKIADAIAKAQAICAQAGVTPSDCITAWSLVEDLQAEAAYQQARPLEKTALEEFLEAPPEWLKPEDFEAWCSG